MLETMVDFPPNPEDGELWLPSDVLHEIASTNIEPETSSHQGFIHNAAYDHVEQVAIHPKNSAPRYLPDLVPNYEVHGSFNGTKPNGNGVIGNRVLAFDHQTSWDAGYPLVPGHMHPYNSFTPTQTQGFEKTGALVLPGQPNSPWSVLVTRDEANGSAGKSGGTGFFLPRFTDSSKVSEETLGTGVFLNHQVWLTSGKKKKSGKKGQVNQKKQVNAKEARENQEESQLSNEIGLPKDWTY